MRYVTKRDGREVAFDYRKIVSAITAAMDRTDSVDRELAFRIANVIAQEYASMSVEEIQDKVEQLLYKNGRHDAAEQYHSYRTNRSHIRQSKSEFMKSIGEKIKATNIQNQNANVDEASFGGRKGEAANELMKEYALYNCMSAMSRNNHLNNEIYIHDLDNYAVGCHNCLSIPFDDLLANGFNTRQTDVRPANSINTAFQLVAVIFQLQSLQQFGGCSATHLDWTMVPYVRKSFYKHFLDGFNYVEGFGIEPINTPDKPIAEISIEDTWYAPDIFKYAYQYAMDMTKRELTQAVEGMFHNLNTLQSRSGNQLPFTSINFGTCTLPEGRMIIEALLKGSINGVGKHHTTPIFPCSIFQCMAGVNRKPGDPNYDMFKLALQSTAMRLYPNYANVDWSGNAGYDKDDTCTYFATMGCRTANGYDINGFGYLKDGRGNICPVTIILPTLAMEATESDPDHNVDAFMKLLDTKINEAWAMLKERYEYICSQPAEAAKFMYENNVMAGYIPEEGIESALRHGTLAIGQLGLNECLEILIGQNHTTQVGMKLAKRIEALFQMKCAYFKERDRLNASVYFSPSENLCHTAMKRFKEKYGIIKNVSDREYFTNSMHVPVWEKMDPFTKIDIESQLTGYSSAGCITYVELESSVKNNIDALETLVNYAMDKDIPYFAINVPNDTCVECGFTDDIDEHCPQCGSTQIKRLRRVTGYLTGDYKTAFNKGKQQETEQRYKHMSHYISYGEEKAYE